MGVSVVLYLVLIDPLEQKNILDNIANRVNITTIIQAQNSMA